MLSGGGPLLPTVLCTSLCGAFLALLSQPRSCIPLCGVPVPPGTGQDPAGQDPTGLGSPPSSPPVVPGGAAPVCYLVSGCSSVCLLSSKAPGRSLVLCFLSTPSRCPFYSFAVIRVGLGEGTRRDAWDPSATLRQSFIWVLYTHIIVGLVLYQSCVCKYS